MRRVLTVLLLCAVALSFAENGARLLIITTDALYSSIQPLAQWKQACGISTRVVKLSSIGADTGHIHSYIKTAYNSWPVRPEFVLLVGSGATLPAAYYSTEFDYNTDNLYSAMNGDSFAVLPVGRFPARSSAQLDVMVGKTLAYEKTPYMTDSLWFRRLVTVVREDGDLNDSVYWNDVHHCAGLTAAAGWLSCDSLSSSRGSRASNVVSAVNSGRGIVMYRGQATGNWYHPFDVNPSATSDGTRLPIILSATCATLSLTPSEESLYVGYTWLKTGTVSTPNGAVAFIGNAHSDHSVVRVRSAFARGFFDGLFTDHTYELGRLVIRAKQQLYAEHPSNFHDYRGFNLFGDPSLRVWTKTPRRLVVQHPPSVMPGTQLLNVVVKTGGAAVESALVCASMATDTMVYAYGYTDSLGVIALNIAPTDTGRLRIVVTGPNLYPYDTVIPVVTTAVAEPAAPSSRAALGLVARPSVFTGTVTLTWRPGLTRTGRIIVCDAAGNSIRAIACPDGQSATWDGRTDRGRPAPAGVYLCVLSDASDRTLETARVAKLD